MRWKRGTTTRSSRLASGLIIALIAVSSGPDAARAGFCAGELERLKNFFSMVGQRLDVGVEHVRKRVVPVLSESRHHAVRIALWHLFLQSRQILLEEIENESFDAARLASLKENWKRAGRILLFAGKTQAKSGPDYLQMALEYTIGSYAVCQALRQGRPEPCRAIGEMNRYLGDLCRSASVDVASMARYCEEQGFGSTFRPLMILAERVRRSCEVLTKGDAALCAYILRYSYKDIAICRAYALDDEAPCRYPRMSKDETTCCLSSLATRRYLNGLISEEDLMSSHEGFVFMDAVRAARYPGRDCVLVALEQFDRWCASYFQVRLLPIGSVPAFQ